MDNKSLVMTRHVLKEENDGTLQVDPKVVSCTASPRDSATMDSKRMIMTRHVLKKGNVGTLQLDPELWQGLPEELLENIIAKLPFANVVSLRRVCKGWLSGVIPRAARHLEASSRLTLLYFAFHAEESQGSAWWLQLSEVKSAWSVSPQDFYSRSFPAPRRHEDVVLLLCDGGLLFFGFVSKKTWGIGPGTIRDIVVCNPLLSESKTLGLPCRLDFLYDRTDFVVGATFDSETGKYCLVVSGRVKRGEWVTFLYDSLASAWTICSSYVHSVRAVFGGRRLLWLRSSERHVCCNRSLYWYAYAEMESDVMGKYLTGEYVMKFDIQKGTWSVISDVIVTCDDMVCDCQITSYKGKIWVWHLHCDPSDDCGLPGRSDRNVEMFPEIKLMPAYEMKNIYRFVRNLDWGRMDLYYKNRCISMKDKIVGYAAFNERNFIYHVVAGSSGVRVLVHDTNENSYTTLPVVLRKRFPNRHHLDPENVWSFSASLTSLP